MEKKKASFQIGYTIGGEHGVDRSARLAREKKAAQKRKKKIIFIIIGAVSALTALGLIMYSFSSLQEMKILEEQKALIKNLQPSVDIKDENQRKISSRVEDFVARVEEAFNDDGHYKVEHVILPKGRAREADIYLKGRNERYKMNLDRGAAVQAEDALRMLDYLKNQNIKAEYVDVRVEGKAFYK